ncbi:MAG: amidohydrolase family protein [Phycisphaerae bacterium]|nr:amidohydrolase family protein [Phycisphaerae bacterium]
MRRFVDCHTHLLLGGRTLTQLDLSKVSSRGEFEAAIAAEHARLPKSAWLEAHGWNEGRWGGERPTRDWLLGAGDRPVVAYRMDQHACVVNDAVRSLLRDAIAPAGGEIVLDDRGERTGLMLEQAAWQLVNPLVPAPSVESKRDSLRAACAHAASLGLEAVCSMEYLADAIEVFDPLRAELPIRIAITLLDRGDDFDPSKAFLVRHDDRLWVNGFKSFADGTLGSRTARMLENYSDDPGNRGMLVERALDGTLSEWARAVIDAGLSPSVHAIGDEALRVTLDAIEPVDPQRTTRFEHAQTIHPDDVPRLRGRLVSMQPLHRAFDREPARTRLGAHRMNRFFPFRALLDHGAILGFGSDWPIVDLDPRKGLEQATRPRGASAGGAAAPAADPAPEWCSLTNDEALAAYGTNAPRFLGAPSSMRAASNAGAAPSARAERSSS